MSILHVTKVENVFFPQGVYIWADLEMGGALKLREGVGSLGGKTWLVLPSGAAGIDLGVVELLHSFTAS